MLIKDTKDQYGLISIVLHWFVALAVITALITGTTAFIAGRGPLRTDLLNFHMSVMSIAAPFVLFRLYWRFKHGKPKLPPQHPIFDRLAAIVWRVLAVGIVLQLFTGPQLAWMHNHPIGIIGFAEWPSPWPAMSEAAMARIHSVSLVLHMIVGFGIGALLVLHIGGALKHLIIDQDGVFTRMIRPGARAVPSQGQTHTPGRPTPDGAPALQRAAH